MVTVNFRRQHNVSIQGWRRQHNVSIQGWQCIVHWGSGAGRPSAGWRQCWTHRLRRAEAVTLADIGRTAGRMCAVPHPLIEAMLAAVDPLPYPGRMALLATRA